MMDPTCSSSNEPLMGTEKVQNEPESRILRLLRVPRKNLAKIGQLEG